MITTTQLLRHRTAQTRQSILLMSVLGYWLDILKFELNKINTKIGATFLIKIKKLFAHYLYHKGIQKRLSPIFGRMDSVVMIT